MYSERFSPRVRTEIIRIYEYCIHQTNFMIEKLHEKQMRTTKIQIYNLIHRHKVIINETRKPSYFSEDIDEAYVAERFFKPGCEIAEDLRIFMTTCILVQLKNPFETETKISDIVAIGRNPV
ncbi:hypothetical protein BpHYR1_044151 [Brachionus plicatilis]|uniref:Uncharacterized protein n=1 Tax=Brachionus plicatilis TaxID=10195 RepID=A0A3M7SE16_BRAPC|nr:hypothetical protein BpHYR1_044151 [Brachionus plicatilis]